MTEKQWPADNIERRKVADLVPYARNSRTHSPTQVDQLAASIKEWGFTNPILIDETGTIIAGHGRVMAAQKLGLDELPCMTATGWTEAQRRAYVIADNKLALNADWDVDALKIEMDGLGELNFDLKLTGFDMDELAKMFDEVSPKPPKEFEEQLDAFQMIVTFSDEELQAEWFQSLIEVEGIQCKLL
jgi:ParB-like chromosome segregation protein Spo0J|tara:strand:- start:171 stop:731 length:561 start_codon:yes stop_codon:yes gene_type:complete